ncbi:hypothetical protein COBT_001778 [Conglomerata obtusa]
MSLVSNSIAVVAIVLIFAFLVIFYKRYINRSEARPSDASCILNQEGKLKLSKYKHKNAYLKGLAVTHSCRIENISILYGKLKETRLQYKEMHSNPDSADYKKYETNIYYEMIKHMRRITYNYVFKILNALCRENFGSTKNSSYHTPLNKFHKNFRDFIELEYNYSTLTRDHRFKKFEQMIILFLEIVKMLYRQCIEYSGCDERLQIRLNQLFQRIMSIEYQLEKYANDSKNNFNDTIVDHDYELNRFVDKYDEDSSLILILLCELELEKT